MKALLTLAVAVLGSGITIVLAMPSLKSSVLKTDIRISNHTHLTSSGSSASSSSSSGGYRAVQLAAADRLPNDHHAGYIIQSFVKDGFDFARDGPSLTRNISARYTVSGITAEPDQYVHGQISMHQQIQIGGDSGGANTDGCNGNFVTLGTQSILTYSGRTARRPYYYWAGDGEKSYLGEDFGPMLAGDEIYSHIYLKGTSEAEIWYENASQGTRFVKTISGQPICLDHSAGSWTVGYEPEEEPGSPEDAPVEPMPGFDARIFWDANMYSGSVSDTRLPYSEPMDLVRQSIGNGEGGAPHAGWEVQHATSFNPFPGDYYFGVYWNLIPSWVRTESVDYEHN
ncbi:hypothetical protein Micbo1qcDRAFT_201982 [Microdochium bolleyi]|uniref:Uncharacterized protein n=1 Tax=Microdochium bolleyi TaxID=196109 RepID=A0A136JA97_9PEZI|nr:hypothetical protein Micbo1qcDRAFT_201982 [Microdochium bolleyi]